MKKITVLCIAILLVVTLFTGCSGSGQKSPYNSDAAVPQEGFSVKTEFPTYPADTKTINLIIENNSENEYYYGYQYSIEMKKNNEWYVVPLKDEMSFIAIAKELPAHTTDTYAVTLENFSSKPKAGDYRVVFNQTYLAEFQITD